jgi:hypothetical protein
MKIINRTSLSVGMAAILFFAGCGKANEPQVVAPPQDKSSNGDAGPYSVEFLGSDQTYDHSLKGIPRADEGKIEYSILTPEKSRISVLKTELKVYGCPLNQVSYQSYWIPDAQKSSEGQLVFQGLSFEVQPNLAGVLIHVVKGLQGCSEVEFVTSLKRTKILPPYSSLGR